MGVKYFRKNSRLLMRPFSFTGYHFTPCRGQSGSKSLVLYSYISALCEKDSALLGLIFNLSID
jgi:hypothetical protein